MTGRAGEPVAGDLVAGEPRAGEPRVGELRAGAARTDITPADLRGLDAMTGGFTGVHDALFCRAVVVDDGVRSIAVVSLDLLEVGSSGDLRSRIERELGIGSQSILIAASHSHTAPRVGRTPAGGLSRPPTLESLAYTAVVFDAIVATVREAQSRLQSASLGFGRGRVDVNVNRDELRDSEWMLGQNPDGASDKTLRVIAFRAHDGSPIATLACYAVHPTVSLGTTLLGADLAGAAAAAAESELGGVVLWLPGSIGDQAPRLGLEHRGDGFAPGAAEVFGWVDALGREVAEQIVGTTRQISSWQSEARLGGSEVAVPCAARRGSGLKADMTQDDVAGVDVRLTLLCVGDVALVGVGGEVTTPAAELITSASPRANTVLVSIANERIGYLADDDAFARGTFAARGCPVQPGWDTAVARALAAQFAAADEATEPATTTEPATATATEREPATATEPTTATEPAVGRP
ncbi:neutral/alkaline non-lysosomal ceramidase N-terminal domain-containing protein [Subtercola sp. YIM 133946]|uniref:neutral/alkaline non-lysosomal ceramidase N-terminal domain-containing protein n=1 Tax=Subtercola sp. YIM 133946 TaxID=3118909 RepID=UPI002F92F822